MIHRIFLLVISSSLLLLAAKKCPDHYNPAWFEESSDELNLMIEEYFLDQHISFLPSQEEMLKIGLHKQSKQHLELPHATVHYHEFAFPIRTGLWRYDRTKAHINTTYLLLKEPAKLSEIEAINTYNDLLGAYWGDYDVTGYQMTLLPEDSRIRYKDRYFELNVKIYGLKNDATALPSTYTDILFRDYTQQVKAYMQCKEQQ